MAGKVKSFWNDFKAFASRGNVIDMAVGVVVGGAFSKIVNSLVNDLIMPLISVPMSGVNFTDWKLTLVAATEGVEGSGIYLTYGNFIQAIINFFFIALSVFIAIRVMAKMTSLRKKAEEAAPPPPPPAPSKEELLLTEIRDLLKKQNGELPEKSGEAQK